VSAEWSATHHVGQVMVAVVGSAVMVMVEPFGRGEPPSTERVAFCT
jgi:hypothetical protein